MSSTRAKSRESKPETASAEKDKEKKEEKQ